MVDRLVLCTGSTGYLGSVLAPLVAQKHHVRAFDSQLFGMALAPHPNIEIARGDITDREQVRAAMDGVDTVVHLAGIVTDRLVDTNPLKAYRVNIEGTQNVAEVATQYGVSRFIYVSSSSVYGWAAERDGEIDETVVPQPKTTYAAQKLAGERIVRDTFGLMRGVYCVVRPATMCGPSPRLRLDVVVNVFAKQAYFDHRLTVHGGKQWRSNVHVRDAAEVLAMLVDAPPEKITGAIFNLTWGDMTVGAVAELAAKLYRERYEKPCTVEYQDVPDNRSYRLTARALHEVFGWMATRTMAGAINDMFTLFESGAIDPSNTIHWNDKRLADLMAAP